MDEAELPKFARELLRDPLACAKSTKAGAPELGDLLEFFEIVSDQLRRKPNLVELGRAVGDVLFVGDTHGDLRSTTRVTTHLLEDQVDHLAFLGDYVDRGAHQLLNFAFVLSLAAVHPKRVTVLRGNHEDLQTNRHYGFLSELALAYPSEDDLRKVVAAVDATYDSLSLAVTTAGGTIGFHGGVPKTLSRAQDLLRLPKPHSLFLDADASSDEGVEWAQKTFFQLSWNDPNEHQSQDWTPSFRGPGIYRFGEAVLDRFLSASGKRRLVRAHESSRGGFQSLWGGKLLHVFSTEPYFGQVSRACVVHEESGGRTVVRDLDFNELLVVE